MQMGRLGRQIPIASCTAVLPFFIGIIFSLYARGFENAVPTVPFTHLCISMQSDRTEQTHDPNLTHNDPAPRFGAFVRSNRPTSLHAAARRVQEREHFIQRLGALRLDRHGIQPREHRRQLQLELAAEHLLRLGHQLGP